MPALPLMVHLKQKHLRGKLRKIKIFIELIWNDEDNSVDFTLLNNNLSLWIGYFSLLMYVRNLFLYVTQLSPLKTPIISEKTLRCIIHVLLLSMNENWK